MGQNSTPVRGTRRDSGRKEAVYNTLTTRRACVNVETDYDRKSRADGEGKTSVVLAERITTPIGARNFRGRRL
jgi:hypothetical protein